jgi:DmsA/YnfE family anaerobic dimethyl sulfoxide reductase A subunit
MEENMGKIISTSCPHDCGGKCLLLAHVDDGKISKLTTVKDPRLRACVRGLNSHHRPYLPDRLKYPLKRTGRKGEGKFERISWSEALGVVSRRMEKIKHRHGNSAILLYDMAGECGQLHTTMGGSVRRFLHMYGGATELWGAPSFEGLIFATRYTFGDTRGNWDFPADANESDDLLNSRFIILWGVNPKDTIQGTGTFTYLKKAKKAGIEIVCIDPLFTNTAKHLDARWIPISPGTDTAMLAAMAYVIITAGLDDEAYLDTHTVGYEKFRDYVLGKGDHIPKTPAWAEEITRVPASTIENIAGAYAKKRPAALIQGYAPGRTRFGEQFHRMAITLQAMTGNIGVHGGSAGNMNGYPACMPYIPVGENPIQKSVKKDKWADCILHGKNGGYPADIKMMLVVGGNPLNQMQNTNKGVRALRELDFLVVNEQFMTPTARYADIVLPVTTHFERNDIYLPWMKGNYAIYAHKVIEPMFECKSDLQIFTELADLLGIDGFNPKTEDEWLRGFVEGSFIPDYDEFKREGIYRVETSEPWVAFKDQIEAPDEHSFPTPSGKIEIFSETLASMDFKNSKYGDMIPAIPKYIPDADPLAEGPGTMKYPLKMVTPHLRYRCHSIFANLPALTKRYTHQVWINPLDAVERGIKENDTVHVFNELGKIVIKAKITDHIMDGVIAVFEGTWFEPNAKGMDEGGCANVLTTDNPTPAGAFPYNSDYVQIEKQLSELHPSEA